MTYKRFGEFKKLSEILSHIHYNAYPVFTDSLSVWEGIVQKQKWYRCLSVTYLVEKSIYLGKFMQAILLDSPSPGLLLYFVRNSMEII